MGYYYFSDEEIGTIEDVLCNCIDNDDTQAEMCRQVMASISKQQIMASTDNNKTV